MHVQIVQIEDPFMILVCKINMLTILTILFKWPTGIHIDEQTNWLKISPSKYSWIL